MFREENAQEKTNKNKNKCHRTHQNPKDGIKDIRKQWWASKYLYIKSILPVQSKSKWIRPLQVLSKNSRNRGKVL